jgi:thiosulfate/3-mercaptopyruvate sulfurtransferase
MKQTLIAAALALAASPLAAEPFGPLVSTGWLEERLGDPSIRVLEVSVNPGLFEQGHVPGAVNLAWHSDLVDRVNRDLAPRDQLQATLRAAGISEGTRLVLYGDTNNWFAAWAAWVFELHGVGPVALLDGGRKKWEAEGRPLSREVTVHAPGTITVAARDERLRARLPDVLTAVGDASAVLVDIRSPAEYRGEIIAPPGIPELSIRAGHIPGAVNAPWGVAVAEDGTFKPAEELRRIYAEKGVDGSKPIITYCRIGERSSHTWFALSKILGYDVRNYDGSWTEYGNSVGVPIVNLAATVWKGQ